MTIALSLLISAMQLLTMVQANPNLPPAFVTEVELIANHAITVAKEEIAKAGSTTTTPTPEPTVINNYYTTPPPTQVPMGAPVVIPEVSKAISLGLSGFDKDPVTTFEVKGGSCGAINQPVFLWYSAEVPKTDTMNVTYPDGTSKNVELNLGYTRSNSDNYLSSTIYYSPKILSGTEFITITKGELKKTLKLEISPLVLDKDSASLIARKRDDGTVYRYELARGGQVYNIDTYQCN